VKDISSLPSLLQHNLQWTINETTQLSIIQDWINKIWYIYTMEYYSVIEILSFAAPWMEMEIIMLSEINCAQKSTT
jgi:hypothetical protein